MIFVKQIEANKLFYWNNSISITDLPWDIQFKKSFWLQWLNTWFTVISVWVVLKFFYIPLRPAYCVRWGRESVMFHCLGLETSDWFILTRIWLFCSWGIDMNHKQVAHSTSFNLGSGHNPENTLVIFKSVYSIIEKKSNYVISCYIHNYLHFTTYSSKTSVKYLCYCTLWFRKCAHKIVDML